MMHMSNYDFFVSNINARQMAWAHEKSLMMRKHKRNLHINAIFSVLFLNLQKTLSIKMTKILTFPHCTQVYAFIILISMKYQNFQVKEIDSINYALSSRTYFGNLHWDLFFFCDWHWKLFLLQHNLLVSCEWMIDLFNATWAIFQPYHGENKLHSKKWWWYQICTRPTW